ncbi:MAG: orotate phosphoribosyltransferase [Synergistaceae bacterium]|nr:orotate phosphoribosyltransferase [Synergistaceae bacterium]
MDCSLEFRNEKVSTMIQKMMKESGAHLEGHFQLTSGLHSGHYLQCALMLRFPKFAAYAGEKLAERLAPLKPEFILSPALGGLIIGYEVARVLDIPFIFCERQDGGMRLRRFTVPDKKRFVMVEDVVTTGKSSIETAQILVNLGAEWIGSASIIDRRSSEFEQGLKLESLWKLSFPVYEKKDCPFCAQGLPLVKPGSRPDQK